MSPLRKKRLLLIATTPYADHKAWYNQYCQLMMEGLVGWTMGTAWLTDKGKNALEELKNRGALSAPFVSYVVQRFTVGVFRTPHLVFGSYGWGPLSLMQGFMTQYMNIIGGIVLYHILRM